MATLASVLGSVDPFALEAKAGAQKTVDELPDVYFAVADRGGHYQPARHG